MRFSILLCLLSACGAELISVSVFFGGAAVMTSFWAGYNYIKCTQFECCDQEWVPGNMKKLRYALEDRLHGQHLVEETVVRALKAHYNNPKPKKALVLSLHGGVGVGKNFVSKLITESWLKRGSKSAYVNWFIATAHFPHKSLIEQYKMQMQSWITGNITRCERSIFVFDEVDALPEGLLDQVTPYIDVHESVSGVDYRHAVFILLSNTASHDVNLRVLKQWKGGRKREDLTAQEMERIIHEAAFNEDGGLKYSRLISKQLIDHVVPLLPLERRHIKQCIVDYFETRGFVNPGEDRVNKVADALLYFPHDSQVFSTSGCKKVAQKVDLLISEEEELREEQIQQRGNREEF